jgi:aldose 1-epimerase
VIQFGYDVSTHADFGKETVCLYGEDDAGERQIEITYSPEMGCNMFSLLHDGTEYLLDKTSSAQGPALLGSPVLYPSPNRIRNARFDFDGRQFRFEPNDGTNFLHGLVAKAVWSREAPEPVHDGIAVRNSISFLPGTDLYEQFPIHHRLELTYTLHEDRIRLDFVVVNLDDTHRLPFGFGIHPYFNVIGTRGQVRLDVPAKKWMEATGCLPSGRLVDLEIGPADFHRPKLLSELDLDDVFWGLEPDRPQVISYESIGKRLTLSASGSFTHSCVFCPPKYPIFCVENQTCSADAHNLHAQRFTEESNLLIAEPGESHSGHVEIRIGEIGVVS